MKSWARGSRMYVQMVNASIRAQMQYRYAFFMNIIGWAMSYAGTAVTMWVMLHSFGSLEGWTLWELIFLFALAVLSWGICVLFFFHFRSLDQYILNGTFDRFLVRPIHPFFHFMAMKFDIGAFGQLLFSIVAVAIAYHQLQLEWTIGKWGIFAGAVLGGTLIQGGLLVLISAIAFWTTRSERFYWVVMFPAKSMMNYPLTLYPRIIQWVVIVVIPFAFVNYLPALLLLDKSHPFYSSYWGSMSAVIGLIFFWICYRIWMLGLDRYKSTGS
ncbi:ABC transporter permease [Ammoniphilus sp. CFH 90114]|uniref:ABC transporter permease n=1 Tax=Ammoniphilus sp. CFH 90114 TaxID=2493665 RepID=UPI00100FD767|nr:ABC-2 family transporter protein [Ammoniphilus sp. CFH 90114]RXT06351.1 ABC transporter permease [Ammoniphilus sp. CFH 90114]